MDANQYMKLHKYFVSDWKSVRYSNFIKASKASVASQIKMNLVLNNFYPLFRKAKCNEFDCSLLRSLHSTTAYGPHHRPMWGCLLLILKQFWSFLRNANGMNLNVPRYARFSLNFLLIFRHYANMKCYILISIHCVQRSLSLEILFWRLWQLS